VGWGEMPIERGDSWFSPKCIEVQPGEAPAGGRALLLCGGFTAYQATANSEYRSAAAGVRRAAQTLYVERETTQTCG
jgi:hypothetical protein